MSKDKIWNVLSLLWFFSASFASSVFRISHSYLFVHPFHIISIQFCINIRLFRCNKSILSITYHPYIHNIHSFLIYFHFYLFKKFPCNYLETAPYAPYLFAAQMHVNIVPIHKSIPSLDQAISLLSEYEKKFSFGGDLRILYPFTKLSYFPFVETPWRRCSFLLILESDF